MGTPSTREVKAGEVFGRLTTISRFQRRHADRLTEHWLCRCSCGGEARAAKNSLLRGGTQSCGCLNRERIQERRAKDLEKKNIRPGNAYGRLTVVEQATVDGCTRWRCRCSCGKEVMALTAPLLRGAVRSCGCLRRDVGHRMGFGFSTRGPRRYDKPCGMTKCGNCMQDFDPSKGGVTAVAKGRVAAGVCGDCLGNATKFKLVLSRGEVGGLAYEQYSCLETRKAAG